MGPARRIASLLQGGADLDQRDGQEEEAAEDDDSWMDAGPGMLDAELEEREKEMRELRGKRGEKRDEVRGRRGEKGDEVRGRREGR